jgi:hypothetical protein
MSASTRPSITAWKRAFEVGCPSDLQRLDLNAQRSGGLLRFLQLVICVIWIPDDTDARDRGVRCHVATEGEDDVGFCVESTRRQDCLARLLRVRGEQRKSED